MTKFLTRAEVKAWDPTEKSSGGKHETYRLIWLDEVKAHGYWSNYTPNPYWVELKDGERIFISKSLYEGLVSSLLTYNNTNA